MNKDRQNMLSYEASLECLHDEYYDPELIEKRRRQAEERQKAIQEQKYDDYLYGDNNE